MNLQTGEFTYLNRYCVGFFIDSNSYLWYFLHGNLVRLNLNDLSDMREISLRKLGIRFEITKITEYRGDIYFGTRDRVFTNTPSRTMFSHPIPCQVGILSAIIAMLLHKQKTRIC